jgi:tetratricopeptide (TPR) repeat protein
MLRVLTPIATLLILSPLLGCAHQNNKSNVRAAVREEGPRMHIETEDEYVSVRADYDALAVEDHGRPRLRRALSDYLSSQLTKAIGSGHPDEAFEPFREMLTLYDPSEIRGQVEAPDLHAAAERMEAALQRRGAHQQVLTALCVERSTSQNEAGATGRYRQLVDWLKSGGPAEDDEHGMWAKDGVARVVTDLEAVANVWPSDFVVAQLTTFYLERPTLAADPQAANTRDLGSLLHQARKVSSALHLTRLYLRVSRPDEGLALVRKLAGKMSEDDQLRGLLEKLVSPKSQPADAIAVASLFAQTDRDDREVALRVCRDAARRFPSAAEPRLCAGQLALSLEQMVVAQKNFEEAIKLEPTRREAWEALARIYQVRLFQLASDENLDVRGLEPQLTKVLTFHQEAERRFPSRPLRPSLDGAVFEVGRGYYNAGRLEDARRYLERSLSSGPNVPALELLGQISLKKGEAGQAVALFAKAAAVPRSDQAERLFTQARIQRQLGDANEAAGNANAAETARKSALDDWEALAALGLTPEGAAEAGIERAKLLYALGDRDASLRALEKAIDAAPDRGSTYADGIAFLVSRGELEEALDAYHRALGRNEVSEYLKVYCSLWIIDLAHRAGQPEDPLAAAYLKSTDGAKWYDDLARWATGRQSEKALLEKADSPAKRAEASFYRAMRASADGKATEAQALWREVLHSDMLAFFEYDMASLYLKLGTAPAQPILKSKPSAARPSRVRKPRPPEGSI